MLYSTVEWCSLPETMVGIEKKFISFFDDLGGFLTFTIQLLCLYMLVNSQKACLFGF